jgi:hypothetical protein
VQGRANMTTDNNNNNNNNPNPTQTTEYQGNSLSHRFINHKNNLLSSILVSRRPTQVINLSVRLKSIESRLLEEFWDRKNNA